MSQDHYQVRLMLYSIAVTIYRFLKILKNINGF